MGTSMHGVGVLKCRGSVRAFRGNSKLLYGWINQSITCGLKPLLLVEERVKVG